MLLSNFIPLKWLFLCKYLQSCLGRCHLSLNLMYAMKYVELNCFVPTQCGINFLNFIRSKVNHSWQNYSWHSNSKRQFELQYFSSTVYYNQLIEIESKQNRHCLSAKLWIRFIISGALNFNRNHITWFYFHRRNLSKRSSWRFERYLHGEFNEKTTAQSYNFYKRTTQRTRKDFWKNTLSRCFCKGGAGDKSWIERSKSSGVFFDYRIKLLMQMLQKNIFLGKEFFFYFFFNFAHKFFPFPWPFQCHTW